MKCIAKEEDFTVLEKCLCCDGDNLRTMFDLGKQPLANTYTKLIKRNEKYPLALNVCHDCFHLQLSVSVYPEILFKDYVYLSGMSEEMKSYYKWFVLYTAKYNENAKTVYEIACNDGCQLDAFKDFGFQTFGIDPAENLHRITLEKYHNVTCSFFPPKQIGASNECFYDIVVAQNVFAHVPNPYEFLLGCEKIMHDKSFLFIQTSQADMVKNSQFDTIYHEHISFFNTKSMNILVERAGLKLIDVEKVSVHGTSYIFTITK